MQLREPIRGKAESAFRARVKKRIESLVFFVFIPAYAVLAFRLVYVQVVRHEYWSSIGEKFHLRRIVLHAKRGVVFDRNGRELAVNVPTGTVVVNPRQVPESEKPKVAEKLSQILGVPRERVLKLLALDRGYVYVQRKAPISKASEVEKRKLAGVIVEKDSRRYYPAGSLASQVLGVVDIDGRGLAGVELAFDPLLRGSDGEVKSCVDAMGRLIPSASKEMRRVVNGKSIILSIDSALQQRAEAELDSAVRLHSAKGGVCVVLDVSSGEILALAQSPRFDANKPGEAPPEARLNKAVSLVFEPGSTLKTVTCAAALDSDAVSTEDTFNCSGCLIVGKHVINCVIHPPYINGHGAVNIANILRLSCNVGAARVALRIGEERLSNYLRRFGFGSRTGVELPGESPGILPTASQWRDITLANVAFGQGVAVTALQLASAYAAIANDGIFVAPTILKRENGRPKVSRQVVSEQTARLLRKYLQGVVDGGTGKAAKIRWYKVAGKTGTAQKAEPGRGYIPGKYVALMVGFVPVDKPRVVVLAAIDEPSGSHYGGVVAAPVFREVARAAMVRLNVPPEDWSDTFDGAVPSTWPKGH